MESKITSIKPMPPKAWLVEHPKAFVLGCDPTAFHTDSKGLRTMIHFNTVFNLGGSDLRYFAAINNCLKKLNLNFEVDLYVQNLVTAYQQEETSKNKQWNELAKSLIPERRAEFDKIDPDGKLPVFLTSERLYRVLLNDGEPLLPAAELYQLQDVMIPAEKNKLGRPLIALYRHPKYNFSRQKDYFERVKNALNSV